MKKDEVLEEMLVGEVEVEVGDDVEVDVEEEVMISLLVKKVMD